MKKPLSLLHFCFAVSVLLLSIAAGSASAVIQESSSIETIDHFLSDLETEKLLAKFQGLRRRLGDYNGSVKNVRKCKIFYVEFW